MSSTNNITLKNKIQLICEKIEQILEEYKSKKEEEQQEKKLQNNDTNKYNSNTPSLIPKINYLKGEVEITQKNLEKVYNIEEIIKIESEIKKKQILIKNILKEQKTLNEGLKKQNSEIDLYSKKFISSNEQNLLSEKLKQAKEENHINKETHKLLTGKIKGQMSKIDVLEKKCTIIKQNIEFQKKKQKKEVEKSLKEEDEGEEEDIEALFVDEKMLMLEINDEEKSYKNEIYQQKIVIQKMNDQIKNIQKKINEIQKEKKNEEYLKKKELLKNKELNRKNENIKKSRNSKKSSKKPFKISKFENNSLDLLSLNKRTHTSTLNNNENKKFKINFSLNKTNIKNNVYITENITDNDSALLQIEQLKEEIQNALKNNVAKINETSTINYPINNNEIKKIKSCGIMNTDIDTKYSMNTVVQKEKHPYINNNKNLIDNYDNYKNKNINYGKAKPFEKIYFK